VVVAASHGLLTGVPRGLETREGVLATLGQLRGADAIMVSPGLLPVVDRLLLGRDAPGLVIDVDWKSWNRGWHPPNAEGRGEGATASIATIEEVAAAGADGVMSYLYVGHQDPRLEREEIIRTARYARDCERLGLTLIVEPRSAQEGKAELTPGILVAASRMAAEIGADIIKSVWPGSAEGLAAITEAAIVPVLLAGGPSHERADAAARLAEQAIGAGAAGVMFGRKIYASSDPAATLARVIEVVHSSPVR
jgi:class I fructose-bisphosphate aldolase